MIKIVKDTLRKSLQNARLTYDELSTVLIEIENIMNSRPLTYMSEDSVEAITPFHLLHGRNISVRGGRVNIRSNDRRSSDVEYRTKHVQFLVHQYWSRFYSEYTVALREQMLYDRTKRENKELLVGDVVIIVDDKTKPVHWKKGRIEELIVGRDSIVRGVRLQSTTPTRKTVHISRPIQKIIPLEISINKSATITVTRTLQI